MRKHFIHISRNSESVIICLIIALIFEILAAIFLSYIEEKDGLYYRSSKEDSGVTLEEAYNSCSKWYSSNDKDKKPYEIIFWNDAGILTAEGHGTGKNTNTQVIYTCGRTDLLISDTLILEYDDQGLCLLGRQTAYNLFGTVNAEGLKVRIEDRDYIVADVTEDMENVFIAPAWKSPNIIFDRTTVRPYVQKERLIIQQEIERGLEVGRRMENDFVRWLLEVLVVVFPVMWIGFATKAIIYRNGWKKNTDKTQKHTELAEIRKLKRGIVIVTAWIISIAVLCFAVNYPQDMMPPAWSDFEFWGEMINEKIVSIETFLRSSWTEHELEYVMYIAGTVFCAVGALCFSLFAVIKDMRAMKNVICGQEEVNE